MTGDKEDENGNFANERFLNEYRLSGYLCGAVNLFLIINSEKSVELVNDQTCQFLNKSRDDIIGCSYPKDFLASADECAAAEQMLERLITLPCEDYVHTYHYLVSSTGKKKLVFWHYVPLLERGGHEGKARNAHKNWVMILGRELPINIEEEFGLWEEMVGAHGLIDQLPGMVYICKNDAWFTMIYLNQAVQEITGYSKKEFIQGEVNLTELIHYEDLLAVRQKIDEALIEDRAFSISYRIFDAHRNIRWVEEKGARIYHCGGLELLQGFIYDVTGWAGEKNE